MLFSLDFSSSLSFTLLSFCHRFPLFHHPIPFLLRAHPLYWAHLQPADWITIYLSVDGVKDIGVLNCNSVSLSVVYFMLAKASGEAECRRSLRSCRVWGFVLDVKGQSQSCAKGQPFLWRKLETKRWRVSGVEVKWKTQEEKVVYVQSAIFISLDALSNHQ